MFLAQKENPELFLESCRKVSVCDAGATTQGHGGDTGSLPLLTPSEWHGGNGASSNSLP